MYLNNKILVGKNEKYEAVPQVYFVDGNDIKINEKPAEQQGKYYVTGNEEAPNEYNVDGTENDTDLQYADEEASEGQWIFGVMGGYGTNELKQRKDKASMNDINLGLYGGYESNKWLLKGMLLGGYEQYTIDRTIEFMDRTANSDHNGYSAALDLEAGYKISLNKKDSQARHKMYLKPFVGVIGSYMNNEGYEEKNAESLNLKVENYDAVTAEARAGLEINGKIKKFGWYAKAGVRQLLTDKHNEIEMSLLDFADETKMKIWSAENAQTTLTGGIGADYDLSENWTIFANGLGNFAEVTTNYYANIGLVYKFGCKHNKKVVKENNVKEVIVVDNSAEEELRRQLEEKERELQAAKAKEEQELKEREKRLREAQEREKALREAEEREKALQEQIQDYEAKIVSEQEAQQMKEKTIKSIRISGPTFNFGTTQLSADGKGKLKEVAKEIQNYPDADVLIEGHTDSVGSDEVNQVTTGFVVEGTNVSYTLTGLIEQTYYAREILIMKINKWLIREDK